MLKLGTAKTHDDNLAARLISLLDGDLLPLPAWDDLERNEQRVAVAVHEVTGMTPEHWAALGKAAREPWLEKTIAALAKGKTTLTDRLGSPPTPLQWAIWDALDGKALTKQKLAAAAAGGDEVKLYYSNRKMKTGGLTELLARGLVANKRTVGYYRPDSPPQARN